jgi:hypothetical protein
MKAKIATLAALVTLAAGSKALPEDPLAARADSIANGLIYAGDEFAKKLAQEYIEQNTDRQESNDTSCAPEIPIEENREKTYSVSDIANNLDGKTMGGVNIKVRKSEFNNVWTEQKPEDYSVLFLLSGKTEDDTEYRIRLWRCSGFCEGDESDDINRIVYAGFKTDKGIFSYKYGYDADTLITEDNKDLKGPLKNSIEGLLPADVNPDEYAKAEERYRTLLGKAEDHIHISSQFLHDIFSGNIELKP